MEKAVQTQIIVCDLIINVYNVSIIQHVIMKQEGREGTGYLFWTK